MSTKQRRQPVNKPVLLYRNDWERPIDVALDLLYAAIQILLRGGEHFFIDAIDRNGNSLPVGGNGLIDPDDVSNYQIDSMD